MVVRETHYFRKPPYTLYPPLHLPCLTFVQLDALHGRLNQLLGIAGVLVAVAAVASHATYFYDGGFQDSCFDESYWKEVQVDKQVISYLYKSNTKKTQIDQLDCFLCVFFVGSIWLPNWPGQPRQPVLTPSILDHKIHQRTTMRSSSRCGTGVDTLDHSCCGQSFMVTFWCFLGHCRSERKIWKCW